MEDRQLRGLGGLYKARNDRRDGVASRGLGDVYKRKSCKGALSREEVQDVGV